MPPPVRPICRKLAWDDLIPLLSDPFQGDCDGKDHLFECIRRVPDRGCRMDEDALTRHRNNLIVWRSVDPTVIFAPEPRLATFEFGFTQFDWNEFLDRQNVSCEMWRNEKLSAWELYLDGQRSWFIYGLERSIPLDPTIQQDLRKIKSVLERMAGLRTAKFAEMERLRKEIQKAEEANARMEQESELLRKLLAGSGPSTL